jgi:hypothetical protein
MRIMLAFVLVGIAVICFYLAFQSHPERFMGRPVPSENKNLDSAQLPSTPSPGEGAAHNSNVPVVHQDVPVAAPAPQVVEDGQSKSGKPVLPYTLENGMFVVQGDLVVGIPTRDGVPPQGQVEVVPGAKWTGGVIPFHIQPDVVNPERVYQALAMFEGSAIRFVQQQGEEDVLVFEPGDKNCLSYVGKIGGKQPVYLAPGCGPTEIAHEVLHALGFVHEQNRTDRDNFITVNFDNIEENFKHNFEKLPTDFMSISGLGPFDFESIMIYPAWMFAKGGRSTMEPNDRSQVIRPAGRLSVGDLDRLNRAYR